MKKRKIKMIRKKMTIIRRNKRKKKMKRMMIRKKRNINMIRERGIIHQI